MDTQDIELGNVHNKQNGALGWIFGHFIDPQSPFHTEAFEMKWKMQPKGKSKGEAKANKIAKSVSILRSGRFKIDFPDLGKSVVLEKEGDYAYFAPGVRHTWEALEDSHMMTIRWPSIPGDQQ